MSKRTGKKPPADPDFTLRRIFGKANFRPYQREIITAALEGHDVFVQAGEHCSSTSRQACVNLTGQKQLLPSGRVYASSCLL